MQAPDVAQASSWSILGPHVGGAACLVAGLDSPLQIPQGLSYLPLLAE